jgi:hypothetical protein
MFAKVAFGLAFILATASGALAGTKTHVAPGHNAQGAYTTTSACAHWFSWPCGIDPNANVRFELNRNWARGY